MEKYEIQKLRDLPIEEVAGHLGLQVNAHHKALCPFHDDHHASLSFNARKNSCRCFVCMEKSLGTIDLVMRCMHVDFLVACHWLADKNSIQLSGRKPGWAYSSQGSSTEHSSGSSPATTSPPHSFDASRYLRFFEHPWLSDEARRFLFEERRLDERVVRWCRLTSWQDREGTHWLQIPYFDMEGQLIGIQNRNLDYGKSHTDRTDHTDLSSSKISMEKDSMGKESMEKDSMGKDSKGKDSKGKDSTEKDSMGKESKDKGSKEKPRFRFPSGAKCGIYNLPVVKRMKQGDELYITEGCSDCWAMLSAGHKAIAIPSATLLTPEDKELLASLSRRLAISWHMYPDRDAPGERLFLQLKELLPSLVHHQLPVGCKDFSEAYLMKVES